MTKRQVICNVAGSADEGDGCSTCPHARPHEMRTDTYPCTKEGMCYEHTNGKKNLLAKCMNVKSVSSQEKYGTAEEITAAQAFARIKHCRTFKNKLDIEKLKKWLCSLIANAAADGISSITIDLQAAHIERRQLILY